MTFQIKFAALAVFKNLQLLFSGGELVPAVLENIHAATVGGNRVFQFKCATFHIAHDRFEFGECRLKLQFSQGSGFHGKQGESNRRKYPIRRPSVKLPELCNCARLAFFPLLLALYMQSLWMLVASFLFACMGLCVKLAAQYFSVAEIVFYRSFISLLIMAVLVRLRGVPLATPYWRMQLTRGLFGFAAIYAYFLAITLLPLATAITLNYTSSIFLALGLLVFGWRLTPGAFGALLAGFAGVVLLLHPTWQAEQLTGGLVGLGSGVLAAVAVFNVRELGACGEPECRTVFHFSLISSLCAGLWLVFQDWHSIGWQSGFLLLGVGGFAAAAQLAMTRAYTRGATLTAAALAYSTVIFASLFGALFFFEVLDTAAWLGMLLIVVSGVAASRFARTAPGESD